jgi:hypothetical protein
VKGSYIKKIRVAKVKEKTKKHIKICLEGESINLVGAC